MLLLFLISQELLGLRGFMLFEGQGHELDVRILLLLLLLIFLSWKLLKRRRGLQLELGAFLVMMEA
jgi:hypothetical protein